VRRQKGLPGEVRVFYYITKRQLKVSVSRGNRGERQIDKGGGKNNMKNLDDKPRGELSRVETNKGVLQKELVNN